jgi:hypothetical protein
MKPSLALASLPLFLATYISADTGNAFYGDPPDDHHPWAIHDRNRPQPPRVEPATPSTQEKPGKPPSDAVVLFDGTEASLAKWCSDKDPSKPTGWIVVDGTFQCKPGAGYVRTKDEWADCQLHVEWSAPSKVEGNSQGRGNSGVFPMGQGVEVQVLDNYNNPTYADGFAGSIYGINPPAANVLHAPGEWQVYDIVFRRPIYKDGKELDGGYITVFVNGVLTQDHTPLDGGGGHMGRSKPRPFAEKGPLKLQDHGNPVRYRNIWYRPLGARSVEGGTDGYLTTEATMAKRKEIATDIRSAAGKLEGTALMYQLMESLTYENDPATLAKVQPMLDAAVKSLTDTPKDKIESKKGDVMSLKRAVEYLGKCKVLPNDHAAKAAMEAIIKTNGWDKK